MCPRHAIARLNPEGSLDTSFDPDEGPDGEVRTVLVQSDGKVVIGGTFSSVIRIPRNRLARLRKDGSLDLAFDPFKSGEPREGRGHPYSIEMLTPQSDGRILVLSRYQDRGVSLGRLLPDGQWDTGFGQNNSVSDSHAVRCVVVRPGEKILLGRSSCLTAGRTSPPAPAGLSRAGGAAFGRARLEPRTRNPEIQAANPARAAAEVCKYSEFPTYGSPNRIGRYDEQERKPCSR